MRQVNPSHNSVVLSLLGFPINGVREPSDKEVQLQLAWRLLLTHNMFDAAELVNQALIKLNEESKTPTEGVTE